MERYNTDCLIIGGGVSGLAIGRNLSKHFDNIFIVERNYSLGQETSSRNSEVIHAGIYYDNNSLKSKFCLSGKELLYKYLKERNIAHKKCGKLIISNSKNENDKLLEIKKRSENIGVSLDLLSKNDVYELEPEINCEKALLSKMTGILDVHDLMENFIYDIFNLDCSSFKK